MKLIYEIDLKNKYVYPSYINITKQMHAIIAVNISYNLLGGRKKRSDIFFK